jgi:hypothetical protein
LKNLDDLKRKNKPLFIDKSYDYFQTVLIVRFGSTVANAAANIVGAAAAVLAI